VRPDPIEEATAGGIIIAETIRDAHGQAQTTGTLVAVGEDAWKDFARKWAEIGEKVMYSKYGGLIIEGMDGKEYRLLNDEQITAVTHAKFRLTDVSKIEKRQRYGT
jgi:co-chaperonin GroES (HSP10)